MRTETIVRAFRQYLRRHQLHGTYLAVNLHRILLEWLALDAIYHLYLDGRTVPEQVALIESVETMIRSSWQKNSQETRRKSKNRQKSSIAQQRQMTFKF